jgi:WD40 repeat protein
VEEGPAVSLVEIARDVKDVLLAGPSPSESETESEATARRVTKLSLENASEGGSTLLRTLELTAQTRSQRVRVKSKRKGRADFSDLHLVQQLSYATPAAVYVLKFSPDGAYLAAGCADGLIRVWEPLSEQLLRESEAWAGGGGGAGEPPQQIRTAALFTQEPVQLLAGHTAEVLDLSWSSVLWRACCWSDGGRTISCSPPRPTGRRGCGARRGRTRWPSSRTPTW